MLNFSVTSYIPWESGTPGTRALWNLLLSSSVLCPSKKRASPATQRRDSASTQVTSATITSEPGKAAVGFPALFDVSCEISLSYTYLKEKAMAPHSSTLAWKIPWSEEPGGLQSMGLLRVGHDWATSLSLFTFKHWRRKWQPTPVFMPGESQGQQSLVGCRLWSRTESDTTEET